MAVDRAARSREHLQAWKRWRKSGLASDHSVLAGLFQGLVVSVAKGYVKSQPAHVDMADLISAGNLGLTHALERFELARGVPLGAYAVQRINGAILDYLRSSNPLTRGDAGHVKRRATVEARLAQAGKAGTVLELAEGMGWTVERLGDFDERVGRARPGSLDAEGEDGEGGPLGRLRSRDRSVEPEPALLASESRKEFGRALATLTHRDRVMLLSVEVDGLTLHELGAEWGVSESRVAQINGASRGKLAALLPERRAPRGPVPGGRRASDLIVD